MVLHAKAKKNASTWIICLAEDKEDLCILHTCLDERSAHMYTSRVNAILIPRQRAIISKMDAVQKILSEIMKSADVKPTTSDEFIMSVCKVIRYIALGKATTS